MDAFVLAVRVVFTPAVVTEGDRVRLTCSTSCPLSLNTSYVWTFDGRPLNLTERQNKHVVLDPVSSQHAGSYSCAVQHHSRSADKALTVNKPQSWMFAAAGGVAVAFLGIRSGFKQKRNERTYTTGRETSDNTEQVKSSPQLEQCSLYGRNNIMSSVSAETLSWCSRAGWSLLQPRPLLWGPHGLQSPAEGAGERPLCCCQLHTNTLWVRICCPEGFRLEPDQHP